MKVCRRRPADYGVSQAIADTRYCQLTGCTMGGAFTAASAGLIFNGTVVKAGGANILNIGNGTNAQSLRVYNTDDGAGNAEYGQFDWSTGANTLTIGTVKTGTGTLRNINMNAVQINLQSSGTTRYAAGNTGFVPAQNNSLDLGNPSSQIWRTAYIATSIQGSQTKTLTETTPTTFVKVGIASGSHCAGTIVYEIYAADATPDQQARTGELYWAGVNKAGTITMQLGRAQGSTTVDNTTDIVAVSAGTLTNAFTSTQASNEMTFLANATSSLTQTTLQINYRVNVNSGTCTVTGL
jgi:hypothetical protein